MKTEIIFTNGYPVKIVLATSNLYLFHQRSRANNLIV